MRVALITSVAGNGGSAHTAFQTARLLARAGHQTTLFAPGDYWATRGQQAGVNVNSRLALRRGFRGLSFLRDLRILREFLARERTDAVIVQKSPEQWLAHYTLATLTKKPVLVRMRGVVFAIHPSGFNRRLHNRMELVLCSASVIARQYAALPGFRTEHVKVLLEGVDTVRFAPARPDERKAARERFRLDADALILGTAGRPSPVKGHDVLVRAFAKAYVRVRATAQVENRLVPNIRLCIFTDESRRGPGSYAELRSLCEQTGVAAHADLRPGFIEDMRLAYDALDAYVLPSQGSEGSSRAGLEASACGLPLLASCVGVLPDLVQDGVTGRLLPPGDEDALAAALETLMRAGPDQKKLGEAARARMLEAFREEDYVAKLSQHLEEAVGKARKK